MHDHTAGDVAGATPEDEDEDEDEAAAAGAGEAGGATRRTEVEGVEGL
jgi:hypothetical protein